MIGEVSYRCEVEPEHDVTVRGNAMASGDNVFDRQVEDEIIARLDAGEVAAWCCVRVIASIEVNGHTFEGFASIGACSYADEAEACREARRDYGLDDEAREDLIARLEIEKTRAVSAREALKVLKGED